MRLNAKELRLSEPTEKDLKKIKRRPIYIICDNILDTYNIGAIFRLADAVAAKGVYLCGSCQTPPYHRIAKAAVGTEKWVPWQHFSSAKAAISNLKFLISNIKIIAIEQSPKSIDYRLSTCLAGRQAIDYRRPVAFVVGHETSGVSPDVLAFCDEIVEIPMFGVNKSLNVMVSLAIVLYRVV